MLQIFRLRVRTYADRNFIVIAQPPEQSQSFLRHLLRLEERPIMRYVDFTTEITVKTAGASHSFVEFVERNFDMLLAGLRCFDSAYPANPIPTGKWGNILP